MWRSGGPAFTSLQEGKIGGIAFSKLTSGDNIGYIIPSQVVTHFLTQYVMHGEYRGCCSEGFRWQEGENAHLRSYLKVSCRSPRVKMMDCHVLLARKDDG